MRSFVIGVLYFIPASFLMQYAGRIKAFTDSPTTPALEHALAAQKNFWKSSGICGISAVCLYTMSLLLGF